MVVVVVGGVEVQVEAVGLSIMLWLLRWRKMKTGVLRREETKLMIARRGFWEDKKMMS